MVALQIPDVHLEAMETPKDKGEEPHEVGGSRRASLCGSTFPKGLLENGAPCSSSRGYLKQKTRTGGILQYP